MKPFLSTLSLRRATVKLFHQNYECFISIHALLAESDLNQIPQRGFHYHFYPRSPCGERLYSLYLLLLSVIFLSTLSLRRATTVSKPSRPKEQFLSTLSLRRATNSIGLIKHIGRFLSTLSLRRATKNNMKVRVICTDFYPRSPCGERRAHYDNYNLHCVISIHALLAESDCLFCVKLLSQLIFLSTLSLRRATSSVPARLAPCADFYPRSPCGERP